MSYHKRAAQGSHRNATAPPNPAQLTYTGQLYGMRWEVGGSWEHI